MSISRRRFVTTGLATVGTLAAAHGVARAASKGLRVTRQIVPWPVSRLSRVVQMSDVHVGCTTPTRVLEEAARIAHALKPDAVVLTGDYVNMSLYYTDRLERFARSLPGPVIATLGNHDHYAGDGGIIDALRAGGATVLVNQSTEVDTRGGRLPFVGLDDGLTKHQDAERALRGVDPERAVVLSHFPNTADEIAEQGGRLILSGHTHGGQMDVPKITPLLSRIVGNRYYAGWYDVGHARLYVTAGIGASAEGLRGGKHAQPEVTVVDLVPTA